MIFDNSTFIKDFSTRLRSYWKTLQEQYETDVELGIIDTVQYIKERIDMYPIEIDSEEKFLEIMDIEIRETEAGRMINNILSFRCSESDTIELKQKVFIRREDLYYMLLTNLYQIDEVYEYFKISLLHELGHVLSNIDLYSGLSIEEFVTKRGSILDESKRLHEEWGLQSIEGDEYIRKYNQLPEEMLANERMGITVEDMVQSDKKISEPAKFSVVKFNEWAAQSHW